MTDHKESLDLTPHRNQINKKMETKRNQTKYGEGNVTSLYLVELRF